MFEYSLTHWTAFLTAAVFLTLSPGPDLAFILGQTIRGGRRAGFALMLGIWTGAFGHVVMAAAGLSALLMTSATAFTIVKWIGAAYLIGLGVQALRSSGHVPEEAPHIKHQHTPGDLPAGHSDRAAQSESGHVLSGLPAAIRGARCRPCTSAIVPAWMFGDHGGCIHRACDHPERGSADTNASKQSAIVSVVGPHTRRPAHRVGRKACFPATLIGYNSPNSANSCSISGGGRLLLSDVSRSTGASPPLR
jgi:hypothetical protein